MSENTQGGYRIGIAKGQKPTDSDWPLADTPAVAVSDLTPMQVLERDAIRAGTHEPTVDDFGNQYLAPARPDQRLLDVLARHEGLGCCDPKTLEHVAQSLAAPPARRAEDAGPGWWHPADCTDLHDEDHNCLDETGSIIGWRDPVTAARLSASDGATE